MDYWRNFLRQDSRNCSLFYGLMDIDFIRSFPQMDLLGSLHNARQLYSENTETEKEATSWNFLELSQKLENTIILNNEIPTDLSTKL